MNSNNKVIHLVSAGLLSLALSACGGGGGGSSSGNQTTNPNSNSAPTIEDNATDLARADATFSFIPSANDPDNDGLIFEVQNKPDWASFDGNTGELFGMPSADDVGVYPEIIISVSDGAEVASLSPFTLKVLHGAVGREDIAIDENAAVVETDKGYDILGDAAIVVGDITTEFNNADLQFEFDAEGNLLDLAGTTDLPPVISENLSLDASVQAIVGLYTGAEINASADIGPRSEPGILLKDEFKYLVYFIDASLDLVFHPSGDGDGDIAIPLEVAGTRVLIMSDPTDPFFYYFGQVGSVEAGFGYSYNRYIPWVPQFQPDSDFVFDEFEAFEGQVILKGSFPMGVFKAFELFQIHGEAVCLPPQLFDCGKPSVSGLLGSIASEMVQDGIDPSQQAKLGFNGGADLEFRVFGIDLFSYELLDVSATAEVGTDRQAIALQGVFQPGNAQQPDWFQFQPAPDSGVTIVGNLFANVETATGEGDFGLSLYGEIDSFFPAARLEGAIDINSQGMQMTGFIDDPENPLSVSARVDENQLDASIQMTYDINANIDALIDEAFDRAIEDVNQALADLDNATADYSGAVSLNGFRSQLPSIIDDVIGILDTVPQRVYDAVYSGARSGMNSDSASVSVLGITFYARDYIDVNARAASWARRSRNETQDQVNTRKSELENLRTEAERAEDTPAFRAALKSALQQIASRDRFSYSLTVRETVNFPSPAPDVTITFYQYSYSQTVISASQKSDLQTAAANVDDIAPTQTVMIDTQDYLDSIPAEQAIETARSEVKSGVRVIPTFRGVGYTITRSGDQTIYVLLGEDRIEAEFNPLDPVALVANLTDLIAKAVAQ